MPALHIANPALLSLFTACRTTGVVLDVGHGMTSVVPIHEGSVIADGMGRVGVGGQFLTEHLLSLVVKPKQRSTGCSFALHDCFREMKVDCLLFMC